VIVCPKCRQHAQIIETGKNTMRCQRCGTIHETRRLRIFYSSEDLDDAVNFRTRLQAEISGKGSETLSLKSSAEGYELSKSQKEDTENIPGPTRKRVSENLPPRKDRKSNLLDLLEAAGGEMQIEEFQQKALEKGISPEKFDIILKKLLETGELYSPEPGIVKFV
jgi:uncharacterized protein YbaR (Trm112 family)